MADAALVPPTELLQRIEDNPDGIIDHLGTQSGNAQYAVDIFNLERAYQHALTRTPRLRRRGLYRRQQEVLAALGHAHKVHVGRKVAALAAAATEGRARLRAPGEPVFEPICPSQPR